MRELTINDIHIGMIVAESWLRKIYDTYITLVDAERRDTDVFGRIAFIGSEMSPDAGEVMENNDHVYSIYNSKEEDEGEVVFDE